MEELEETREALRKQGTSPSADLAIKLLRLVRELRINDPESVAVYGARILERHRKALSEEEWWLLHEQVAVASLECDNIPYAATLIRAISRRFPDSQRANRLKGMYWEAQGQYEQAAQIYHDMIEQQPSCEMAHKRLVALEKSRGNLQAAADALRKYLDVWCNDREAWEELADTYLQLLAYRQALFCYEELLTLAPTHPPYLIRMADVLYTLGGAANLRTARAYYSRAVEATSGASARALWGVAACCVNATDKVVLQDSLTRALIELPALTADALMQAYGTNAPAKQPLVQAVLADLE